MKIISIRKMLPINVYTDKQVCMYVRMDRWMDAGIYLHIVVCIMIVCVRRYVCINAGVCTAFMYI